MVWKPDVTVAAVVERDGRFLFVEERASGRVVINQPAGHLENGETFLAAVSRETLEETGWTFVPTAVIGMYMWQPEHLSRTFLRVAFSRHARQPRSRATARPRHRPYALDGPRPVALRQVAPAQPAGLALRRRLSRGHALSAEPARPSAAGRRLRPNPSPPAADAALGPYNSRDALRETYRPRPVGRRRFSRVRRAAAATPGYDVHALFMRNWDEDEDGYCTAAADLQDARRVCDDLRIPLHTVSFAAEYRDRVFRHFLDELAAGPNAQPGRRLQPRNQVRRLFRTRTAPRRGPVRNGPLRPDGRWPPAARHRPRQGPDVLPAFRARRHAGAHPVSDRRPAEKRSPAHRARSRPRRCTTSATAPAFVSSASDPLPNFWQTYLPARPGPIETPDGRPLGTHRGLMYYTLGQRQGLEVGGVRGAAEKPWYVARKDLRTQCVGRRAARTIIRCCWLTKSRPRSSHWIAGCVATGHGNRQAYSVHRQAALPPGRPGRAPSHVCDDVADCIVRTAAPQRAVTPGQSAVFYRGDACLGGARDRAGRVRSRQVRTQMRLTAL